MLLPKKLRDRIVPNSKELQDSKDPIEAGENGASTVNEKPEALESIDLYFTPGTDGCLELHTLESLNELALQAKQNNAGTHNIRSFLRLFYARAQVCEIDGQGRIRVPKHLAEWASLEKEIVFVGVGFHWEVWDLDRWNQFLEKNHEQFDQIVHSTFDPVFPSAFTDSGKELEAKRSPK